MKYLEVFWKAFYSKTLYRDVKTKWQGTGLLYLLILSTVCALPWIYHIHRGTQQLIAASHSIVGQIPTITVHQGNVSINQPEPYYIKSQNEQRIFAIIDTTGKTKNLEGTSAYLLITKNQIFTKEEHMAKTYQITSRYDGTYTQKQIKKFLELLTLFFPFFALPFLIVAFFMEAVVEVLFYALIAKLFVETEYSYKTMMRFAAIAITPSFILSTLATIAGVTIPFRWIIFIPLTLGYLFYGIKVNAKHLEQKS
jgi:hypothetical protein